MPTQPKLTKHQQVIDFVRSTGIADARILPLELDAVGIVASWTTIYAALRELREAGELEGKEWVGRKWVKPDELKDYILTAHDGYLLLTRKNEREIARALNLRHAALYNVLRWAVMSRVLEVDHGFYGDRYTIRRAASVSAA